MSTQNTNNDAKRVGGYLKEKWTIGMSRISNDEVVRAIAKVSSHKLKVPNPKHMDRLIQATHGRYESGGKQYDDINAFIVQELDLHTHSRNWIAVLKTLIVLHVLMVEGSDACIDAIVRNRQMFNTNHMKDLADSPDGAAQEAFIHSYGRYLEERCVAYATFRFHKRIENDDFITALLDQQPDSALPVVMAILAQLQALLECGLPERALNNYASLEGFNRMIHDGKRMYVVLTRRVMKMLDEFTQYTPKQQQDWLVAFRKYHQCSKALSDLFQRMNNIPTIDFGERHPTLQTMPDGVLAQLESAVLDKDDDEVERVTLSSITGRAATDGGQQGTRSKSPDLFKKKPSLPPAQPTSQSAAQVNRVDAAGAPRSTFVASRSEESTDSASRSPPPAPDPLGSLFGDQPSSTSSKPVTQQQYRSAPNTEANLFNGPPPTQQTTNRSAPPPATQPAPHRDVFDPFGGASQPRPTQATTQSQQWQPRQDDLFASHPPQQQTVAQPAQPAKPKDDFDFFAPAQGSAQAHPTHQTQPPPTKPKDDFDFFGDSAPNRNQRAW